MTRRALSPRVVMVVFAAFFIVWGIISLTKSHRTYAIFSISLGVVWLGLALYWSDSEKMR